MEGLSQIQQIESVPRVQNEDEREEIMQSSTSISISTFLLLYMMVIRDTLLYGFETWQRINEKKLAHM